MRVPLLLLAIISLMPTSASQAEEDFTMLHIIDSKYLPDPLEVTPGLTVIVMSFPDTGRTENETEPHTVTDVRCPMQGPCDSPPGAFDVQAIPPDTSQHPFTAPTELGEYPYFCRYHGDRQGNGMAGVLIVTETPANASPSAPTTPSATPSPEATGENGAPLGVAVLIAGGVAGALLRRRR